MMSGMQILLMVNWLIELITIASLQKKLSKQGIETHDSTANSNSGSSIRNLFTGFSPLLTAFLVLMAVHLLWLIGTANMPYGLDDIFKKLPLLAIPLVVLTSSPLNRKQLHLLFFFYIGTIFVATIIGLIRHFTIPDLPYRDTVPFISHIRFSLNICIAIVLLLLRCYNTSGSAKTLSRFLLLALILWFLGFLLLLRSYTAFIILFVTAIIMLFVYWRRLGKIRAWALTGMVTMTLAIIAISIYFVRDYYGDALGKSTDLPQYTVNGNRYKHAYDGFIENGNPVNDYVCHVELWQQWQKRSDMAFGDTAINGCTIFPTLVRYLNAKGLTKDSVGVAQLTEDDIELIEKGVANPIYVHGSTVRKMYYTMLFEFERYRVYGDIRNSSLFERFALWRGAWRLFCDNPLFGVGTGDYVDALHAQLKADDSQIADTNKHAHNQYLTFLDTFGIVGFLLIFLSFIIAYHKMGLRTLPPYFAIVVILFLSFLNEDTIETLAGSVLFTLIPCLLAKHFNIFQDINDQ